MHRPGVLGVLLHVIRGDMQHLFKPRLAQHFAPTLLASILAVVSLTIATRPAIAQVAGDNSRPPTTSPFRPSDFPALLNQLAFARQRLKKKPGC